MWNQYVNVVQIEDALQILAQFGNQARIVAGATDLILELERGVRKDIDILLDITRIPSLDQIVLDEEDVIHLGPLVTHNRCVASKLIVERAFPLAQAAWEVGAPQIRNRGTVAGNIITASPANDTITPLMALGASVVLRSLQGERVVALKDFYQGVRRTVMRPDEMLVDIFFPAMGKFERGRFIKIGLRRAQAISVVNAAVILETSETHIQRAVVTLGAVAPTIVHASQAEAYLTGKEIDQVVYEKAAHLAQLDAHPIDDVRGSAQYRQEMVRVAVLRALRSLANGDERAGFPDQPPLLSKFPYTHRRSPSLASTEANPAMLTAQDTAAPIETWINGKSYTFTQGHQKTLLRLLREDAGLIGTKEGCAEGECGACTVLLDGMAVMSCLVPAPRAHHAEIYTIEGLAQQGELHPVQQAFLKTGAVQCGYCTPGFIMSAAALLEEIPHPTRQQIEYALTGNLCRCTGYYKIIAAIEEAAAQKP